MALAYSRWLDKAAKSRLDGDEEFHSCPSADCSWGCFMSTRDDGNILVCQVCDSRYCILCKVPMHDDETCEEFQENARLQSREEDETAAAEERRERDKAKEDQRSIRAVEKTTKGCPNCKVKIQKRSGCDHMTCGSSLHFGMAVASANS